MEDRPYKSALEIGDVISLKDWHWVGFYPKSSWRAEEGIELMVINIDSWGLECETEDGKKIAGLKDDQVNYVGKQFTKTKTNVGSNN